MEARIYRTHYEVLPYQLGQCWELQKMWSSWVSMGRRRGYYNPIGYVCAGRILHLPIGMEPSVLQTLTNATLLPMTPSINPMLMRHAYQMTSPPKENQVDAISFLLRSGNYYKYRNRSQFALNLETGIGKTYCTINALIKQKQKALIIVHNSTIKQHWFDEILKYTTMKKENIGLIDTVEELSLFLQEGDKRDRDIYIITHSLLSAFGKNDPTRWKQMGQILKYLGIGVKVIDEAHLFFKSTLWLDFFTDVNVTYYNTATFGRSDYNEGRVYQKAFSHAVRYGVEVSTRKHVNYHFRYYNSNPTPEQQRSIRRPKGVSSTLFADYAFKDPYHSYERAILSTLKEALMIPGRIVIFVPKIENTMYLWERIQELYPGVSSGAINSKRDKKMNDEVKKNARIVITTIRGLGTGTDIKELRHIIIGELYSSPYIADQMIGRLREYGPTEETYVWEVVDTGFPCILDQIDKRKEAIEKKCLSIQEDNVF